MVVVAHRHRMLAARLVAEPLMGRSMGVIRLRPADRIQVMAVNKARRRPIIRERLRHIRAIHRPADRRQDRRVDRLPRSPATWAGHRQAAAAALWQAIPAATPSDLPLPRQGIQADRRVVIPVRLAIREAARHRRLEVDRLAGRLAFRDPLAHRPPKSWTRLLCCICTVLYSM
jgi:hypothetical protein